MSTETTNKKIKIDNGTTFGRTYTDKAIDAKLPTDLIATANKLSLGVGNAPLGNGVNLDGFTYDEATKTLKAEGGSSVGGGISVIELTDKNGTIASTQLGEINANPQSFAFKYNGKILSFTSADSTTYQYCNNTTSSSENNVMTTSTLLTITSSTGAYTITENVHNVVANSIHPANGGDLTNIQVGTKVYSIPSGGGGGKLYNHHIKGTLASNKKIGMYLILQSFKETPFTKQDLMNYAKSTNEFCTLPCYGRNAWSSPNILFTFVNITSTNIYVYNPYCNPKELNKDASLESCFLYEIDTIKDDVHPAL